MHEAESWSLVGALEIGREAEDKPNTSKALLLCVPKRHCESQVTKYEGELRLPKQMS